MAVPNRELKRWLARLTNDNAQMRTPLNVDDVILFGPRFGIAGIRERLLLSALACSSVCG